MTERLQHFGVIGAGAWGTALAQTLARAGRRVTVWAHHAATAEAINTRHENPEFLPGAALDPGILATPDLAALAPCDAVLSVAPAQHTRAVLAGFAPHARAGLPLILCSKGIERESLKLMSEVAGETVAQARIAVLSGPSFAGEVARALPAAVTLACADTALATRLADAMSIPVFRCYPSHDVIGAEVGGAVKNVIAIAAGIAEGRELGRSAHAALVTRGFAEMTRLGLAMGASAETMTGLSGLGDLMLTCSSPQSRNMSAGIALGRGAALAGVTGGRRAVTEGVATAPGVMKLAARHGVETPICAAVNAVLAGALNVDGAIAALLARPRRAEGE